MRSSIPTVVGFFRVLKSIGSQSLLNEVKYSNLKRGGEAKIFKIKVAIPFK